MRNELRDVVIASVVAGIVLLAAMLGAAQAPAYRAPRTADGKPNLNGIWQTLNTANWDLQGHAAQPSLVVRLGAIGAVPGGQSVIEGGEIPYRPEALAKQKENYANRLTRDPE